MDAHLKLLADASLALSGAEEALAEGAFHTACDGLDATTAALAELRGRWGSMGAAERRVIGAAAGPVRERLDAAQARVPRLRAVSEGSAEVDPEQEADPEAA